MSASIQRFETEYRTQVDPRDAIQLVNHIIREGFITEKILAVRSQWGAWMSYFIEYGVVREEFGSRVVRWHLCESQNDTSPHDLVWDVCFKVPEYRTYIMEIIVDALQAAAASEQWHDLEAWTALLSEELLIEINQHFDIRDQKRRYLELVTDDATLAPTRPEDAYFSRWNQVLLGHSGRPEALFPQILERLTAIA